MSTPDRTKLRRRVSLYHPESSIPVKSGILRTLLDAVDEADVTEAAFDGCEKVRLELKVKLDAAEVDRDKWWRIATNAEVEWAATVHDLTAERAALADRLNDAVLYERDCRDALARQTPRLLKVEAERDALEGRCLAAETTARGYRERAERAEHELNRVAPILETARDHVRSGGSFCPTCEGAIRETDGMVCRFCGTDYATMQPRQYTVFSKPVTT